MSAPQKTELTEALAGVEKMIWSYAHWWHHRNPEVELDDLAQEGRLGFCRAFERFRPGLGAKLSSYATPYISQAMRKCVQNTRDTIRIKSLNFADRITTVALDAPWGAEGPESKDTLADCIAAPEADDAMAADADLCALVAQAVETLPRKKRAVIRARFLEGRTLESIGADYGVTGESVRKLCLVALAELRHHPLLKDAA